MNRWLTIFGPLSALAMYFVLAGLGWTSASAITASVTLLCALWWIFEPIPIPFTSLIPLAVFPLLGVLTPAQVGQSFGSPLILLLPGGFMLSTAMADSGAHRRIALYMVNLFGADSARGLVLGFMAAAAVLSMWVSNTATAVMMLPIAIGVANLVEPAQSEPGVDSSTPPSSFSTCLLLGIAYAASIGGVGTIIGPMAGAFFLTFLLEFLRPVLPGAERYLIYGGIALVLFIVQPKGLHELLARLGRRE